VNRVSPGRAGAAFVALVSLSSIPMLVVTSAAVMPPTETLRHGSRVTAADGTLVLYDKVIGIFIVPGHKDTYWRDDRYYHFDHGVWTSSAKADGPWELTSQRDVPEAAVLRFKPPKEEVTAKLPSGREAVYDTHLKVYKVAGQKGVFLYDGRFYRYDTGIWMDSKKDDGPWTPTSLKILPVALRKAVPPPDDGAKVTLPSGETVVYQQSSKLFRIENKPETVLFDGSFYELHGDKWVSAPGAPAGFQEINATKVPGPVRVLAKKPGEPDKKKKTGDKPKKSDASKAKKKKSAKKKGAKKGRGDERPKKKSAEAPEDGE